MSEKPPPYGNESVTTPLTDEELEHLQAVLRLVGTVGNPVETMGGFPLVRVRALVAEVRRLRSEARVAAEVEATLRMKLGHAEADLSKGQ